MSQGGPRGRSTVFMAVVFTSMAGNAGVQKALTVVKRGIALGEIEFSGGIRAVGKHFLVGIDIGVVTGCLGAAAGYYWNRRPC